MRVNSVTCDICPVNSSELPWLHGRLKSLGEPESSSRRIGFSGVRGGGCPWVAAASCSLADLVSSLLSSMENSFSFNHGSLLEESSGSCNLETTGGSSSLHSLFPSTSGSFWALEEDAAGGSFSCEGWGLPLGCCWLIFPRSYLISFVFHGEFIFLQPWISSRGEFGVLQPRDDWWFIFPTQSLSINLWFILGPRGRCCGWFIFPPRSFKSIRANPSFDQCANKHKSYDDLKPAAHLHNFYFLAKELSSEKKNKPQDSSHYLAQSLYHLYLFPIGIVARFLDHWRPVRTGHDVVHVRPLPSLPQSQNPSHLDLPGFHLHVLPLAFAGMFLDQNPVVPA